MKSCVLRLDDVDWINWTGLSLSSEHVLSVCTNSGKCPVSVPLLGKKEPWS